MTLRRALCGCSMLFGLAVVACEDSVGPGCGRCLPATAIGVAGEVWRNGGPLPPTTVRIRILDPTFGVQDTVAGCVGSLFRDTTIVLGQTRFFAVLLYAGFPRFVGCLDVRVAPVTPGGFPPQVLAYPNLALRDTSYHDTLHVTVLVP